MTSTRSSLFIEGVLGFCGWSNSSFGAFSSRIAPPSMKMTRLATSRAKPISCVTTAIVIPSSARERIRSSTSPTISGSSAEVGSSKSMTSGCIISARTMAMRCFCPPESMAGNVSALSGRPMRASIPRAFSSASALLKSLRWTGASVRFFRTVMFGNRLKCWKTMPILRRWRSRSIFCR